MFHQFNVNHEHRDYLRFLWWEGGRYETHPSEYRMTVHVFGAGSSPGCANYGLKQMAPITRLIVDQKRYVLHVTTSNMEDGLTSLSTVDQAINLVIKSKKLCAKGGMIGSFACSRCRRSSNERCRFAS